MKKAKRPNGILYEGERMRCGLKRGRVALLSKTGDDDEKGECWLAACGCGATIEIWEADFWGEEYPHCGCMKIHQVMDRVPRKNPTMKSMEPEATVILDMGGGKGGTPYVKLRCECGEILYMQKTAYCVRKADMDCGRGVWHSPNRDAAYAMISKRKKKGLEV